MNLRLAFALAVVAFSEVIVGCAAERPPPASLDVPSEDVSFGFSTDEPEEAPRQLCEPGTSRECVIYLGISTHGSMNCYRSIQFCRSDGRGWHDCADFEGPETDRAPDSEPEPTPELPSDVDAGTPDPVR
ncbi:MAG: hypothetical protein KIT84_26670 [Labilithrix sp.]|nr:hypothetical protein [Labilithrix sp.]MCW5814638.1 hypothetical protein [Labilithrix sp.]